LGNTVSTPASHGRPRGGPRSRPRGRAGTGRGGESHVNDSGVTKPPRRGGRGRGKPRGSGRGLGGGAAYSSIESMMSLLSSWQT